MGRRRFLFAAIVLGLATGRAEATATLSCAIADAALHVDVEATVGHDGLNISGVRGRLDVAARAGTTAVGFDLEQGDLSQFWIEESELRLRLHRIGEGATPDVDLVIVVRRRDAIEQVGRYRLTIGDEPAASTRRGAVTCAMG